MILLGEDKIVRAWVGQKTGDPFSEGEAIGVLSGGRIIGGFVFTNWTGTGIDMSLAGRGCFRRDAWQAVGHHVFNRKRCVRLQVITRSTNRKICKIAPRMKFKFEGTARRYYGNEDGKVFSLLRNEALSLGYFQEAH